ncbi:MAG: ABC-2 family transporter protein [Gemmataceae bacterium]|nr:ABC-2 family transporter protein [Gemmataceae bacterium]
MRLFRAFARVSLLGDMAFRGNFLIKVVVELLWLGLMVFFYDRLFDFTAAVAGWSRPQYFFFLGTYYLMESLIETFFLSNFGEFSELVRTGNLDLVLLKPVDEQFLISFRHVEWSTLPSAVFGLILMTRSILQLDVPPPAMAYVAFAVGLTCAVAMAYSFLLMLSATAVWLVRNQSLYELWWLFMSLMRYPKEIFNAPYTNAIGWFFTFIIPVLLAVNVPAASVVKLLDSQMIAYLVASAVILLFVSRRVFRRAMQSYRSASS